MSKKVLIVGSGFGGLYAAKGLLPLVRNGQISLTIVDSRDHFLFTPLLHEAATASLDFSSIIQKFDEIFKPKEVRIVRGTLKKVEINHRRVILEDQKEISEDYDYLILSTGAQTNYYGVPGAGENSLVLKSLDDAKLMKDHLVKIVEKALASSDNAEIEKALNFIIVGGGATGVELAAEINELVGEMLKKNRSKLEPKVSIVSSGKTILEQFPESLRQAAESHLIRQGIRIIRESVVSALEPGLVKTADGREYPAGTIVWVAGVKPNLPQFDTEIENRSGRLVVDDFLRLKGHDNIFVLGDAAALASGDKLVPMLAQVAVAEGLFLARNLKALLSGLALQPFHFSPKGSLVSLGRWYAVGQIYGLNIRGPLAWWIWRTVYLFKFGNWKKRLVIAWEWTINIFCGRSINYPTAS